MPFVACSFNVAGFCHNSQVFPAELYSLDARVRILLLQQWFVKELRLQQMGWERC